MKRVVFQFSILAISLAAGGPLQSTPTAAQVPTKTYTPVITGTTVSESTLEMETIEAIPTFTPLTCPCPPPAPYEISVYINNFITIEDNGKTFFTDVASRFWIYLDDTVYLLRDFMNSLPVGLIGYISNGSVRGPQCYPIMFEAVHEGKGLIKIKDFQLSIIVDNNLPMSTLPLH
jgi:hypothetical protein